MEGYAALITYVGHRFKNSVLEGNEMKRIRIKVAQKFLKQCQKDGFGMRDDGFDASIVETSDIRDDGR